MERRTDWVAVLALVLAVPTAAAVLIRGVLFWRERSRATISVRSVAMDGIGMRSEKALVLHNEGPATATLTKVELVDAAKDPGDPLYAWRDYELRGGVELLPGEEHAVSLSLTYGTPWPLSIQLTWVDGRRGEQSRLRVVSLPAV